MILFSMSHTQNYFSTGLFPKEREILKTNVPLAATEGTNKKMSKMIKLLKVTPFLKLKTIVM